MRGLLRATVEELMTQARTVQMPVRLMQVLKQMPARPMRVAQMQAAKLTQAL